MKAADRVVALGGGGRVSIYNSLGSLNIAVDVEGYFAAPAGSSDVPGLFHGNGECPARVVVRRANMEQ